MFEFDTDGVIGDAMSDAGIWEFFEEAALPEDQTQLYHLGQSLEPGGREQVRVDFQTVNDEFISYFAKHPERMHETLDPRKFEELVAAILRNLGWRVDLTPRSGDGELVIRAYQKDDLGEILTLVECKKWAPDRPVGPEIVRALRGVLDKERATRGLIITTSRFTRGAEEVIRDIPHRMALGALARRAPACTP